MTKQELAKMIYDQDKKTEKNKLVRGSLAFLTVLIGNAILFYAIYSTYEGESIETTLLALFIAFVYSAVSFPLCATMFHQLFQMNSADEKVLNSLKERFNNHEYED